MNKKVGNDKRLDFSKDANSIIEDVHDSIRLFLSLYFAIPIKTFLCKLNNMLIWIIPFFDRKSRFNSIVPSIFAFFCVVYSLFRFFFVLQFLLDDKDEEAQYYFRIVYPIQNLLDILLLLLIFNHGYETVIFAPLFNVVGDLCFFTIMFTIFKLDTYLIMCGISLAFTFPSNCYTLFAVFMSYLYPEEPMYNKLESK